MSGQRHIRPADLHPAPALRAATAYSAHPIGAFLDPADPDFAIKIIPGQAGHLSPFQATTTVLTRGSGSEAFAQDLDTFFDTAGLFHRQWQKIRKYRRNRTLLPGFPQYLDFEAQAVLIRAFNPQLVSGLLQTEGYMRALMSPEQGPGAIEERVAGRMHRQATVFDREVPPQAWFVFDEAVLHRAVGGRETMRVQLVKLRDIASSAAIHVRIVPFESVTYAGLDGMFVILTLPDGSEVAYHEGPGVSQLTQDPVVVNEYRLRFDLVMGESCPRGESLKMINQALENLE